MFLQGIAFTLLTGLLWSAVGAVYSRAAEKQEGFYTFLFTSSLFFALTAWGTTMPEAAPATEVLTVAALIVPAGIAGQLGFLALREAMRRGSHGISWCIAQSAMLCPFAAGLFWFGEPASPIRLAGMAVLLVSLVPLGYPKQGEAKSAKHRIFLLFALLAFLLIGAQQTLTLVPNQLATLSAAALSWRVPLLSLCGLAWIVAMKCKREHCLRAILPMALLYGVLVAAGQWSMFRALDFLSGADAAGIAYPLAIGSCIALFFLYARFVRKEKSSIAGIVGIILAVTGILLLAF